MLTTLPEELLLPIIEYIAYKPRLPHERSNFRRASSELRSLSVVDHRLRRICLPFLFANICIRTETYAKRLEEFCSISSLCPKFTKVLKLGRGSLWHAKMVGVTMKSVLPSLNCLSTVDLEDLDNYNIHHIDLLNAILKHTSVSSVLVGEPERSILNSFLELDMSKFVFSDAVFHPTAETWLVQGARLLSLRVYGTEELHEEFGLRKFEGIEVLDLFIDYYPVSFSWLPRFSSAHPHLHQLWLHDYGRNDFPALCFIRSLVQESRKQGLSGYYKISCVGLGRATSRSQEWHVTGLEIAAYSSMKEILMLISSLFPALEVLELDLSVHDKYSFDEISSALSPFSESLRTLSLSHVFGRLFFEFSDDCQSTHLVHKYDDLDALAKTTVLSYISRLAQSLTGLENCSISDFGPADRNRIGQWTFEGWLRIHDGNIDSEDSESLLVRVYSA